MNKTLPLLLIKLLLIINGLCQTFLLASAVGEEECGKPHMRWKKGDTWAVRSWMPIERDDVGENGGLQVKICYMAGAEYSRYEVLGEREFDGEPCIELLCVDYDKKTLA